MVVRGTSPDDVINKSRNVFATYLDMETEFNDRFLLDAAARYEYYSDFGGNIAGKLSARYKFSERFMLRASVSNGFRAPACSSVMIFPLVLQLTETPASLFLVVCSLMTMK
jgi:iron complex outermembrane receptor protein